MSALTTAHLRHTPSLLPTHINSITLRRHGDAASVLISKRIKWDCKIRCAWYEIVMSVDAWLEEERLRCPPMLVGWPVWCWSYEGCKLSPWKKLHKYSPWICGTLFFQPMLLSFHLDRSEYECNLIFVRRTVQQYLPLLNFWDRICWYNITINST